MKPQISGNLKSPASSTVAARVFPAQVAGKFYSDDPVQLGEEVDRMLAQAAATSQLPPNAPRAIVAPHAGHRFSGSFAATAYHHLSQGKQRIRRVVMLGPAHKLAFDGIAVLASQFWQTPLGQIEIAKPLVRILSQLPEVSLDNAPFIGEHCLEVHLPFLQRCLDEFTILPVIVGRTEVDSVEKFLQTILQFPDTVILISSDLSHFHTQPEARVIDTDTRRAIELLDLAGLQPKTACGAMPIKGLMQLARNRGLRATTLAIGDSGDVGGSKDRVVGYGSWRFDELDRAQTPESLRQQLLKVATQAIGVFGKHRKAPKLTTSTKFPIELTNLRATFVSLYLDGQLRGCIGSLQAHRSLMEDVMANAVAAAFKDPRFLPLSVEEYDRAEIGISILSHASPMEFSSEADLLEQLVPGEDGLILSESKPQGRATFLPMVWDKMPEPAMFLTALKRKAGLPVNHWSETLKINRYKAEKFTGAVDLEVSRAYRW